MFQKIKAATVAIVDFDPTVKGKQFSIFGSGFCIDPAGVIVTSSHVVSAFMEKPIEQQMSEISPEEKKKIIQKVGPVAFIIPHALFYGIDPTSTKVLMYPCRLECMAAKTDFDIAMLKVGSHTAFPQGFPHLEVEDYANLKEGDEIGTCGFPLGDDLQNQLGTVTSSFTMGIISSIIPSPGVRRDLLKGFQVNLAATNGNSGGPVFSKKSGKVFGIIEQGVMHPISKAMVSGIVKATPVYPILERDLINQMKNTKPGNIPHIPGMPQ